MQAYARLSELKNATFTDVAIGKDGTIHALFRDTGTGEGGEKVYYRSSSDGVTWSPIVNLMADDRVRGAGFLRLVADGAGRIYAFWKASEYSGLGWDIFPAGSLYGGSLICRVLENGAWSAPLTIGPEKAVYSWFPAVTPSGQLYVVYNEGAQLADGSRGDYVASGVIQKAKLTGTTLEAPVEVMRSAGTMPDYRGTPTPYFNGYEGLRGYVDDAGTPHFVSEQLLAAKTNNIENIMLYDGKAERTFLALNQVTTANRFYRHPPQLLPDAKGGEHVLLLDEKGDRPAVVDLDPAGTRPRTPVFSLAAVGDTLQTFQVMQGAGGRMAAFMIVKSGDQPDDLYVSTYNGAAWDPAVNVTQNNTRSDSFSSSRGVGDRLDASFKWYAGYAAGAYDAQNRLNLVFTNAQGTSFVDTTTRSSTTGPVQSSFAGGNAWPYVFFTRL
jgi:hypothetical protein